MLANGGYRLHFIKEYLKQHPHRRPTYTGYIKAGDALNHALNKFVFTFDVEKTSYEYMACTEAVAGLSITGCSLQIDPSGNCLIADLSSMPWKVRREPYEFKTLVDLLHSTNTTGNQNQEIVPRAARAARERTGSPPPVFHPHEAVGSPDSGDASINESPCEENEDDFRENEATGNGDNRPPRVERDEPILAPAVTEAQPFAQQQPKRLCMPEFKLKCGVLDKSTLQQTQLASLDEGRNLRTRQWYRARDDVHGTADGENAEVEPHAEDVTDEDEEVSSMVDNTAPQQRTKLSFSGQFDLPVHVNSSMQHVLDVTLFGRTVDLRTGGVEYEVSELHFGPLFNTCNTMERTHCTAGDVTDIKDMLELKLGQFVQSM